MDVQTASKLARFARHILRRISAMENVGEDASAWRGVFHQLVQLIKKVLAGEVSSDRLAELNELVDRIIKNCFNSGNSIDNQSQSDRIKLGNLNEDGGPGSGNWGHAGVKGQLGGSAPGGGSQNRTGSSETGYSSEAKEKVNASGASGGSAGGASATSASSQEGGGSFGGASSEQFSKAVVHAKSELAKVRPQDAWRVDAHTKEELDEHYPGAKLHITKGGSTVAVTQTGDIISVCKNPGDSARGKDLINEAVANGGTKLDSYSGNHGFYRKCGFEPVSWCQWNDEYAPPDWDLSKGCNREPVIFYKYTGKMSRFETAKQFFHEVPASSDYDAAQKARDDSM